MTASDDIGILTNLKMRLYSKKRPSHQKASLLYAPPALFRNGNMILFIHGRIGLYFDFDVPRDKAVFIKSSADFSAHIHGMRPVIVVIPLRHAESRSTIVIAAMRIAVWAKRAIPTQPQGRSLLARSQRFGIPSVPGECGIHRPKLILHTHR